MSPKTMPSAPTTRLGRAAGCSATWLIVVLLAMILVSIRRPPGPRGDSPDRAGNPAACRQWRGSPGVPGAAMEAPIVRPPPGGVASNHRQVRPTYRRGHGLRERQAMRVAHGSISGVDGGRPTRWGQTFVSEGEGVAAGSGGSIAIAERDEAMPRLDELQDRGRVVDRVVDEATLGEGRDDDGGVPGPRAPVIDLRRSHMVPQAAILVIGDDD